MIPNMCLFYYLASAVAEFEAIFLIFQQIKVAKHIWDQYCRLEAETGS
jgi:hypothetical protein